MEVDLETARTACTLCTRGQAPLDDGPRLCGSCDEALSASNRWVE